MKTKLLIKAFLIHGGHEIDHNGLPILHLAFQPVQNMFYDFSSQPLGLVLRMHDHITDKIYISAISYHPRHAHGNFPVHGYDLIQRICQGTRRALGRDPYKIHASPQLVIIFDFYLVFKCNMFNIHVYYMN